MTNSQVFAAFANRAHAQGGSVRSERTANGVVLYSYATPIAFFGDEEPNPVFTTRQYSVTTAKQKSQAKRAVESRGALALDALDYEDFKASAKTYGASFALAR
jgi:hypothetical protein